MYTCTGVLQSTSVSSLRDYVDNEMVCVYITPVQVCYSPLVSLHYVTTWTMRCLVILCNSTPSHYRCISGSSQWTLSPPALHIAAASLSGNWHLLHSVSVMCVKEENKAISNTVSEIVGYSTWVRWVVSTNIMQFNEFEYHFACRRKVVHLCFITSPGKMIFAVLELWLLPLQWVLNW